ncbi:MAG: hypothetical protein DBY36_08790 [Clostridiales bacterium]|nr:MAG: hypothetical protein DBY36_08790 [Clostridiales bacterium]
MGLEIRRFCVRYDAADTAAARAAELFSEELRDRGVTPSADGDGGLAFCRKPLASPDSYEIRTADRIVTVSAQGLRGMIYGYSHFLRKTEYKDGTVRLICDIDGDYAPDKPLRGHQLGYRPKNNTYDAWTPSHFYRYFKDMMYFNSNIVELMPGGTDDGERNELMQLSENDMMYECAALADTLDLDVSVWYPNCEVSTPEEAAELRAEVLKKMKRLNYVFPPGGDPGDYPAAEFLERAILTQREVQKIHKDVEMWPSAQKPKHIPNWGQEFIRVMREEPEEISGIITGPNRAFMLDELRRLLPMRYPIRFYPDVTHNVRCEYPVHVFEDDWHYAFASTMGRESINPRPTEYAYMHTLARRYIAGSVSYSEGCNDDLNKMVWGYLDYAPDTPVREILEDYARVFFVGADAEKVADGILALEKNWFGDPAENPLIEKTLDIWETLAAENPQLARNWRFASFLFRAKGDAVIRRRRVFELKLCALARKHMLAGEVEKAREVLATPFDEAYRTLRAELFTLAEILFETNGIQLDVEHFHGAAPERGAVLETIDLPITNRTYYAKRLEAVLQLPVSEQADAARAIVTHETVREDEFVFSIAEDTMKRFGGKPMGAYLNFRGDSASYNDGSLPVSLLGLYDDYAFRCQLGGFLPGQDYEIKLMLSNRRRDPMPKTELIITANGTEIYHGDYYGGRADPQYDETWLAGKYISQTFSLPASVFVNGCVELCVEEKTFGVEFSEMRILRAEK